MGLTSLQQFKALVRLFYRSEKANLERLVSPILFAVTMLVLFFFAFGDLSSETKIKVYIAQIFLTIFLALQLAFLRVFEPDVQDDAFTLLRTYPLRAEMLFLAKYVVVMTFSFMVLIATLSVSMFFYQDLFSLLRPLEVLVVATIAMAGLAAVGILISAMMLQVESSQILYPILYFPLTTPVLLGAVQSSLELIEKQHSLGDILPSWLGLVIVFDIIYITLSVLLFSELVKAD